MSRATRREKSTATATVSPNSRKNLPAMPGITPTGAKTATMVRLIAMTVMPISCAASFAAS